MPVVVQAASKTDGPLDRAKLAIARLLRRGGVQRAAPCDERTRGASRLARLSATAASDQAADAPAAPAAPAQAAPVTNGAVTFPRGGAQTPPPSSSPFDLGFSRNLADKYALGDMLGVGWQWRRAGGHGQGQRQAVRVQNDSQGAWVVA